MNSSEKMTDSLPCPTTDGVKSEVSLLRLYLLRGLYLFVVVGIGSLVWEDFSHSKGQVDLMGGVVTCMIASFAVLSILGLRYPLQMLPLFLWEVAWKTLWLGTVALPQWQAGHVDEAIKPTIFACSLVVLFYAAIPWRYVFAHYVKGRGNRWR